MFKNGNIFWKTEPMSVAIGSDDIWSRVIPAIKYCCAGNYTIECWGAEVHPGWGCL